MGFYEIFQNGFLLKHFWLIASGVGIFQEYVLLYYWNMTVTDDEKLDYCKLKREKQNLKSSIFT